MAHLFDKDFPVAIKAIDENSFQPMLILVHKNRKIYKLTMDTVLYKQSVIDDYISLESLADCELTIEGFDASFIPFDDMLDEKANYMRIYNTFMFIQYLETHELNWYQLTNENIETSNIISRTIDYTKHEELNNLKIHYVDVDVVKCSDRHGFSKIEYKLRFSK